MLKKVLIFTFFIAFSSSSEALKQCEWDNNKGIPCINISKTSNSSAYSKKGINKIIITKQDIINSSAIDINDVLKLIPGLDVFQSGGRGQSTSIFTRGSESNHTLVLLNGIPINDQSVTDGLHDFGQDFIHTIQQIEIFKGSNGVHFGPNAIAGAINFITDIDYSNSFSLGGFNTKNLFIENNYTKISDNGWHLNLKGSSTQSETNSAIAKGTEDDGAENYQVNLNTVKWINNNLKFKSILYLRKTKADYDGSSSDENGFVSNNKMYAFQSGIEHINKKSESDLKFHYHKYDREYENDGYLDEYYSESYVAKGEKKIIRNKKISFGYGAEYKYDWGNFENRGSYNASTRGHMKNFGIYANAGYKLNDDRIFSIYARSDDHSSTNRNETYKVNFKQILDQFEINGTHSTGLRNPTLYELYGTDNYGIKGNINLDPEKSKTNEVSLSYKFFEDLVFTSTLYKTTIFDQIETNSEYTQHENMKVDIDQEGMENVLFFKNDNQSISFFSNFSKSRKANGQAQNRRTDLTFGANYKKIIRESLIGNFNLNFNYKYTGKYIDWDGSKNSKQKSTDIIDVSLNKEFFGYIYSLNISNLLDENYEKPTNYSQDGRKINLRLKYLY